MITIIAAVAQNRTIGNKGTIPWHIPSDLKQFKKLTDEGIVIMGKATFLSIGKILPNRTNIILSSDKNLKIDGAIVAPNLQYALGFAACMAEIMPDSDKVFIIGGQRVYEEALPFADRILLTDVDCAPEGDTFFPALSPTKYALINESEWQQGPKDEFRFRFLEFRPSNKDV